MTRIAGLFDCLKRDGRKGLIAYITAGDPSPDRTPALQKRLRVMDSTAFSLCMDNKMPVIVFDFFKPHNLRRAVLGEKVGTLVRG